MTDSILIEQECRTLTRYLIGCYPEPYVTEKYSLGHSATTDFTESDRFGRLLTRVARIHPLLTKMADSYARLFVPHTLLRKKLVLLLAILETCAPSYRLLEDTDSGSRTLLLFRLAWRGTGAVLSLLVGAVLLSPLHLILVLGRERN